MLIMDVSKNCLYQIQSDDYVKSALDLNRDNILEFPTNVGLTGLAIQKNRIIVADKGDLDTRFAPEVDSGGIAVNFRNIMVGPMVAHDGKCKGVVLLYNKKKVGI